MYTDLGNKFQSSVLLCFFGASMYFWSEKRIEHGEKRKWNMAKKENGTWRNKRMIHGEKRE
jgi:hypothetical protein